MGKSLVTWFLCLKENWYLISDVRISRILEVLFTFRLPSRLNTWLCQEQRLQRLDREALSKSSQISRCSPHLEAVVGPAAELHDAGLLVEGEVLHVHLAGGVVDGRRPPLHLECIVNVMLLTTFRENYHNLCSLYSKAYLAKCLLIVSSGWKCW